MKEIRNNLYKNIDFYFYKNKHLIFYILIGLFSLFCELIIRKILIYFFFNNLLASIISLFIGILICFLLNLLINFNVPKYYFFRSLIYFFIIASLSYLFQFIIKQFLPIQKLDFEETRILIASCFFIVAYFFHLKFSFKNRRKVGVAIYLNNNEDILDIYSKVGLYPDFIHIDLIDESMFNKTTDIKLKKIEKIKKLWPNHDVHFHIMSKFPLKWIEKIYKYSDIIYFHYESLDNQKKVIDLIHKNNVRPGIVLHSKYKYNNIEEKVHNFSEILLLCIEEPGYSGQNFMEEANALIRRLNQIKKRIRFQVCIDGGITSDLIPNLKCDKVVSGSDILKSSSPKKQIMRLQTLSRYEK